MSKNILIVESENDKYFIEALTTKINLKKIEVSTPICKVDDYECLKGIGNLKFRLERLKADIKKSGIEKIGIIIDANNEGIQKRIELINKALKSVFNLENDLKNINEFVEDKSENVKFACYIINVNGLGELETVLKFIKKDDSTFADCLENWKKCLKENDKEIKEKDFDKFWLNVYQRFDCCNKNEQKQAGRKCNFEASMKKNIWNFDHEKLEDLKTFLRMFN